MNKIKKWILRIGILLFLLIAGIQGFQYYLVKGNTEILLMNEMVLSEEMVSYRFYLDGKLIKEGKKEAEFIPSGDGLEFFLKPGKHIITIEWTDKGITEEFSFYTFLLVKYIWIWFSDKDPMSYTDEINYHINISIRFKLLDPYNRFA